MRKVKFEWDPKKDAVNKKKHGVSFDEAVTCFEDDFAEIFDDDEHSASEDRYILLGMSSFLRTLVVVHTERIGDDGNEFVNRIISARKATKKEFQYYWSKRRERR
jgi:uncharacterized protein